MRWCLNEGLRQVQWHLLAGLEGASTISLSQDARNHRLLMRLNASTRSFKKLSLTIGQARLSGTDSYAVAATTMSLIRNFATALQNMPPYGAMRGLKAPPEEPESVIRVTEVYLTHRH